MIVPFANQTPRILADADSEGKYHLIGVDFKQFTEKDDQILVIGMNVVLRQIQERQQKDKENQPDE